MVAFQRLVFIYQLGLASAGLAMSILSLTLLTTSPIMAIAPQPVLVGGLVLGLVLTFVAMLGALGAFDDQNTPALVGYGILMLAITGVTIWGITAIGSYLQDEHVETQLDRVWMQSDTNTVLQVESWGQCCGFHNYTDRIQEPCTKYSEEVGCFEVMKKPYVARLSSMMVPGTILLACEAIGMLGNLLVLWLIWRESKEAKMELIVVLLEQPRDDDSQTVLHRACAALEALSERLTREPLLSCNMQQIFRTALHSTHAPTPPSLPQEDTKALDSAEEEFSNFTWNENTASTEANVPAQHSYAHIDRAAAAVSGGPMQALEGFNKERRFSISAEPYTPSEQRRYERIVVPKDDATKSRIRRSVEHNLLFRNLDKEQLEQVIDAMFEKRIPKNVELIRQGDEGDYFYAIDSGKFQVIKDGHFVVELGPGEGFGELALMYGSPRLATVKSTEDSVVWAVDRATFRGIVIDLSFRKRRLYEGFLRSVPILQTLHDSELYRICDALQPAQYKEGQVIVSQGDPGHEFFIIEEGSAAVTIRHTDEPSSDHEVEVTRISTGDYFGELALLHDAPRAATVRALTPVKCVILSKADFIRLLGPVMPILQRNQEHYRKYEEYLAPQF